MDLSGDRVLLISNHHRRSPYFEVSMQRLWNDGFQNLIIQNTGAGEYCNYEGPARSVFNSGAIPYDTGMVQFKNRLAGEQCEVVALMDNDCFLSGTTHFKQYVKDFIEGGFDFACHHISAALYSGLTEKHGCIYHVPQVQILKSDVYPFIVPEPHFENAYLLIRKQMWDRLSADDVSHGRKFIAALVRENAKFGSHEAKYVGSHSHYGDEWFHVGALMSFYHKIESGSIDFNPESDFEMARLGYFSAMREWSGKQYPANFDRNLQAIYNKVGEQAARMAWGRLIAGTCMEDFSKN